MIQTGPVIKREHWRAHFHVNPREWIVGIYGSRRIEGHGVLDGQPAVVATTNIFLCIPCLQLHLVQIAYHRHAVPLSELMAMVEQMVRPKGESDIPAVSVEKLEKDLREWRETQPQMQWPDEWEEKTS